MVFLFYMQEEAVCHNTDTLLVDISVRVYGFIITVSF